MAKRLDIARQTYLDLETGKTEPRITTLMQIAEITGRPIGWFIDQTPEVNADEASWELSRLVELFERIPEPQRTRLLAHHIGLLSCFVEQLDKREM